MQRFFRSTILSVSHLMGHSSKHWSNLKEIFSKNINLEYSNVLVIQGLQSDSQLWMNRVRPPNVFIPKDKGMSDPEFTSTFGIFYPVSGFTFLDTHICLHLIKRPASANQPRLADANKFTSPSPRLKAGFRVVAQPTLGHRPHLRIPPGGHNGQLLWQNYIRHVFSCKRFPIKAQCLYLGWMSLEILEWKCNFGEKNAKYPLHQHSETGAEKLYLSVL